jgi:hypothetical protein
MTKDIWENLWGSVWEIWQVLVSFKNTWDYHNELNDLLDTKYSLVAEWYAILYNKKWKEKENKNFVKIISEIDKKWEYIQAYNEDYFDLIKELVDKDIWFYDMKKRKITANSKSFEIAFGRLLKEIKK